MRSSIARSWAIGAAIAFAFALSAPFASADEPKPWPSPTPREAADPAPLRAPARSPVAPSDLPPISVSGTALLPPRDVASSGAVGDPAHERAQDESIRHLEERLAAEQAARHALEEKLDPWKRMRFWGWVQPQLLVQVYNAAASPNVGADGDLPPGIGSNNIVARTDGATTNGTFFRLRRARLTFEATPTDFMRVVFMIDPVAFGGPSPGVGTIARTIEAIGVAKFSRDVTADFGMGIFRVPFMHELIEGSMDRLFIERTWAEANLFPGDRDMGARARLFAFDKNLQIDAAILNGQTLGMPQHTVVPDLGRGKDVLLRAHYQLHEFGVGLAGYAGEGELVDRTALSYKTYNRFAGNFDAQFFHVFSKKLGQSRAYFEATYAQNLDRGLRYAFALPQAPAGFFGAPSDVQQLAAHLRLEQDLTEWTTLGARYEYYSPNARSDLAARHTFGGLASIHFTKGLSGIVEYIYARDNAAPKGVDITAKEIHSISTSMLARF